MQDVVRALDAVADDDVALVGHSYAGLLVTGAADAFEVRSSDVRHNVMHDGPQRVLELLLEV